MSPSPEFNRFGKNWIIAGVLFSLIYWLWFTLIVGIDPPTIGVYFAIMLFFFGTRKSRILGIGFFPFFTYIFCYNSLKVLHDYNIFKIRIEELYNIELALFGFSYNGSIVTLCEYFNQNLSTFCDIIAGSFYITWAPFPILFGLFLFFKGKYKLLFDFWLCFLMANILGFIGYIVYPAAPPWYYFEYGNQLIVDLQSNAAGLTRFDDLIGYPLYSNMYAQGTNTFGAMPSMHAAFPLILTFYASKTKNKWLIGLFGISLFAIWFAAIYSNHHYIIDVVVGIICAIIGIIITESIVNRKFVVSWYWHVIDYIMPETKN
ncbi:MAG: inositol phosphorylceramide synthase [Saprospiraceae bacterium]|nr:inositol phosphorylceramide synthase [Saprospiraceae bacterium]